MAESAVTLHEETLTRTPTYRGRLFTTETLSVRLHDDSLSTREIIRHPGGAAVVALTDDDRVILVSQYRIAVGAVLLEIPAGKLEPDEDPLGCAQRELAEETGCTARQWRKLGAFFPSPGYLDEALHLYLATDLVAGEAHPDQGEHVVTSTVPFSEVLARIEANEISDAKTIIGILLTDRLRQNTAQGDD